MPDVDLASASLPVAMTGLAQTVVGAEQGGQDEDRMRQVERRPMRLSACTMSGQLSGSAAQTCSAELVVLFEAEARNGLAVQAVNQCVGRVIRHKGDWAAIILVDERWNAPQGDLNLHARPPQHTCMGLLVSCQEQLLPGYPPVFGWCLHPALVSFMIVSSMMTCGELVSGWHGV